MRINTCRCGYQSSRLGVFIQPRALVIAFDASLLQGLWLMALEFAARYAPADVERLALGAESVPALLIRPDADGPHPAAIVQHGYGAEKFDLLPLGTLLAAYGFVVLLADAWGHGERFPASGPNWMTEVSADYFLTVVRHTVEDLRVATDYLLRRREVRDEALVMAGFSMGAMAVLVAGAEDPRIAGIVSLAGSPLPDILGVRLVGSQPPSDASRAYALTHDVVNDVTRLTPRPLLLSHGRRDDMVPVGGILRLHAAALPVYADSPERLVLKLYDHTHHITEEQMRDALDFIAPFFLSEELLASDAWIKKVWNLRRGEG
jgi:dienelactone hydrolase